MNGKEHLHPPTRRRPHPKAWVQRGVYAIEFAFTFLFLFGLIYTIVCYGILLTYKLALQNAAEDAARAALRYQPDISLRIIEARKVALERTQGWWPVAVPAPEPTATVERAGSTCGTDWESRCSILVTIDMHLVDGSQKNLFALPLPQFALPDQLTGQASVLLEGAAL